MGMNFIGSSPGKKVNFQWFQALQNKKARNLDLNQSEQANSGTHNTTHIQDQLNMTHKATENQEQASQIHKATMGKA